MLSGYALWFDVKSGQAFVCVIMLDDASLCDLNPVWEDKGGVGAINKNLSVPRFTPPPEMRS